MDVQQGHLIGLVGAAGAGKDTLASYLLAFRRYHRVAFADRLKLLALRLDFPMFDPVFGVATLKQVVDTEGWEKAKRYPEIREHLQNLGVSVRDVLGADTWVEAAMREVRARRQSGMSVVITDVRFGNEVDAVRAAGGVLCRVVRPDLERVNSHVSEDLAWDPERRWEYEVVNDSTKSVLSKRARALASSVERGDHAMLVP